VLNPIPVLQNLARKKEMLRFNEDAYRGRNQLYTCKNKVAVFLYNRARVQRWETARACTWVNAITKRFTILIV
jgi:hypothetical protein